MRFKSNELLLQGQQLQLLPQLPLEVDPMDYKSGSYDKHKISKEYCGVRLSILCKRFIVHISPRYTLGKLRTSPLERLNAIRNHYLDGFRFRRYSLEQYGVPVVYYSYESQQLTRTQRR